MAETLLKYSVEEKRELIELLLKHLQQQKDRDKKRGKEALSNKTKHRSAKYYFTGAQAVDFVVMKKGLSRRASRILLDDCRKMGLVAARHSPFRTFKDSNEIYFNVIFSDLFDIATDFALELNEIQETLSLEQKYEQLEKRYQFLTTVIGGFYSSDAKSLSPRSLYSPHGTLQHKTSSVGFQTTSSPSSGLASLAGSAGNSALTPVTSSSALNGNVSNGHVANSANSTAVLSNSGGRATLSVQPVPTSSSASQPTGSDDKSVSKDLVETSTTSSTTTLSNSGKREGKKPVRVSTGTPPNPNLLAPSPAPSLLLTSSSGNNLVGLPPSPKDRNESKSGETADPDGPTGEKSAEKPSPDEDVQVKTVETANDTIPVNAEQSGSSQHIKLITVSPIATVADATTAANVHGDETTANPNTSHSPRGNDSLVALQKDKQAGKASSAGHIKVSPRVKGSLSNPSMSPRKQKSKDKSSDKERDSLVLLALENPGLAGALARDETDKPDCDEGDLGDKSHTRSTSAGKIIVNANGSEGVKTPNMLSSSSSSTATDPFHDEYSKDSSVSDRIYRTFSRKKQQLNRRKSVNPEEPPSPKPSKFGTRSLTNPSKRDLVGSPTDSTGSGVLSSGATVPTLTVPHLESAKLDEANSTKSGLASLFSPKSGEGREFVKKPSRGDFASMMAWKSDDKHVKAGDKGGHPSMVTSEGAHANTSNDDALGEGAMVLSTGESHVIERTSWRMGLDVVEEDSADDVKEVHNEHEITMKLKAPVPKSEQSRQSKNFFLPQSVTLSRDLAILYATFPKEERKKFSDEFAIGFEYEDFDVDGYKIDFYPDLYRNEVLIPQLDHTNWLGRRPFEEQDFFSGYTQEYVIVTVLKSRDDEDSYCCLVRNSKGFTRYFVHRTHFEVNEKPKNSLIQSYLNEHYKEMAKPLLPLYTPSYSSSTSTTSTSKSRRSSVSLSGTSPNTNTTLAMNAPSQASSAGKEATLSALTQSAAHVPRDPNHGNNRHFTFARISNDSFMKELMAIEDHHGINHKNFNVAIVYAKLGQIKPHDFFQNSLKHLSKPAEEFFAYFSLNFKELKDKEFSKNLSWFGRDFRFDISMKMSPEQIRQVVGNDVAMLLFVEEGETFNPIYTADFGNMTQLYVVVQPCAKNYRVGVFHKRSVYPFRPYFSKAEISPVDIKDYILTLLHNGITKCFLSPPLSRLREQPRNRELSDLVEKYSLVKKSGKRTQRRHSDKTLS